jgi:PIN domain nuclease of toxin-antitoxin system
MKRMLLDTHVLLWWLADDDALGSKARKAIADANNEVYVSAVSIWEIAIKKTLGKLQAPDGIVAVIEDEPFLGLPVSLHHAEQVENLPDIHRDPFDRMLIAQAQSEGLVIVTSDEQIPRYGVKCLFAV